MKDYYKILGVEKSASKDEIKKAYKKLARTYHPDLNPNNKKAEEKFKELSEAYEIIGDDSKRQQYDRGEFDSPGQGSGREQGQGPYYYRTQGADSARYKDMFREAFGGIDIEELLRGAGGSFYSEGKRGPRRGEDTIYKMEVEFLDSIIGGQRQFTTPEGKNISVKIPAGIKSGQKLRFAGLGNPGLSGGPAGDMYVQIEVRPSDKFHREGDNLEVELPIYFSTALLGGPARVDTPYGEVEVNVPRGVNSGTKLKIKEKGVRTNKGAGDLFAKIKILIPNQIDPKLEAAVREWQKQEDKV